MDGTDRETRRASARFAEMSMEISATTANPIKASNRGFADTIARRFILLALWGFVVVAVFTFAMFLKKNDRAAREDFAVYYLEAEGLRQNVNPYATSFVQTARAEGLNTRDIGHGSDPPTFLVFLIEPLTLLPLWTAYWIWQAANLICLITALVLLIGPESGLASSFAWTFAVLAAFYPPIASHFWFGQSKLPVLLLLVLTMRCLERRRDRLGGIILALAVLLRIFPLVMAGYLVLQRRWRTLAFAFLGLVIGGGITVAVCGLSNCTSFFESASGLVNDSVAGINRDISLYFFVSRNLAGVSRHLGLRFEFFRQALVYTIDLTVLAATARATLMHPPNEDPDSRLFSLWVAASIFLLPVAWDYDLTLMLIPFGLIAIAAVRGEASRRTSTMAVISYVTLVWWEFVAHSANEGGFYSMLAAYLAAYWFATDQPGRTVCPIWSLPAQLWRRIVPTAYATERVPVIAPV